jgi:hypothetical protein
MIEKEHFMPSEYMPDETKSKVRPISFKISFIFALLGLATPFLLYLAIYLIIPTPRNGEDHTPGDGLGMMLLAIFGIIWWTLTEMISLASTLIGFVRKEMGRVKIFAVAASALSLVLIVSVYVGAFAFVGYVKQKTERDQSTRRNI